MHTSPYYNIVVFGEPSVGNTCFVDQFYFGRSFVIHDPVNSAFSHEIVVDGRTSNLTLMDLSTSFLKPEQSMHPTGWAEKMLVEADGIVLLYDITSSASFEYVTNQAYSYLWSCRRSMSESVVGEAGGDQRKNFGCVLVGNKYDLVSTGTKARAVSRSSADEWAQTQGIRSIEVDSLTRVGPQSALELLVRSIWKLEKLNPKGATGEGGQKEEMSQEHNKSSIRDTLRESFKLSKT